MTVMKYKIFFELIRCNAATRKEMTFDFMSRKLINNKQRNKQNIENYI